MPNYRLTKTDFLGVIKAYSTKYSIEKRVVTAHLVLREDFDRLSFALDHWGLDYTIFAENNTEGGKNYTFKFNLPIFKHNSDYGIDRKYNPK